MNEHNEQQLTEQEVTVDILDQDECNFGSIFRIPAPPVLGKMGWSLN